MTERKRFLLRLPPRLHEEIKTWAAQEMRSINGQIEYLLQEAVRQQRKKDLRSPAEPPPQTDEA